MKRRIRLSTGFVLEPDSIKSSLKPLKRKPIQRYHKATKLGWQLNVWILDRLKSNLPIQGLQSRYAHALVFSYYGYNYQVCGLMQKLSHTTRAYIVRTDGLKSFLKKDKIKSLIWSAKSDGAIKRAKQHIDVSKLQIKLELLHTRSNKLLHLKDKYPELYIYVLRGLDEKDQLRQYLNSCKANRKERGKFYQSYVHGWLLPLQRGYRQRKIIFNGKY